MPTEKIKKEEMRRHQIRERNGKCKEEWGNKKMCGMGSMGWI